jgi:hypothetical protein
MCGRCRPADKRPVFRLGDDYRWRKWCRRQVRGGQVRFRYGPSDLGAAAVLDGDDKPDGQRRTARGYNTRRDVGSVDRPSGAEPLDCRGDDDSRAERCPARGDNRTSDVRLGDGPSDLGPAERLVIDDGRRCERRRGEDRPGQVRPGGCAARQRAAERLRDNDGLVVRRQPYSPTGGHHGGSQVRIRHYALGSRRFQIARSLDWSGGGAAVRKVFLPQRSRQGSQVQVAKVAVQLEPCEVYK